MIPVGPCFDTVRIRHGGGHASLPPAMQRKEDPKQLKLSFGHSIQLVRPWGSETHEVRELVSV